MFKLVLEKAEEPEIKLPTSFGSSKKQESFRKTYTSALLTTPKPLIVWITTNCKILKEIEIPDHLTCLLRNLQAGQKGTELDMEQQTGSNLKGVSLGCTLSHYLFNLYAEYIMRLLDWMKDKLESRLPGEKSITSDMQMIPHLWQKAKKY